MRKVGIYLLLWAMMLSSFSMQGQLIEGDFDMMAIRGIKLMGDVNITCVVDSTCRNSVENANTLSKLKDMMYLTVNQDVLTLQTKECYEFSDLRMERDSVPIVLMVSPFLTELENGYNSTLEVKGGLSTPRLQAKLSGNGIIKIDSIVSPQSSFSIITGKGAIEIGSIHSDEIACNILGTGSITIDQGICNELKCKVAGTGKMNLLGVHSQNARIQYSGGGYIKCWVSKSLTTSGLGTTKISYLGNPQVKRKGTVKPIRIINLE